MAKALFDLNPDAPNGDFAGYVSDEPERGRFRVHQAMFTNPQVFHAELVRMFEGGWIFVAHESQVPNPHDFITLKIGRQPIILSRDGDGTLRALLNRCRHRGAKVCREERGNSNRLQCFYHGWVYDSAGKLIGISDRKGYPDSFDTTELNLVPVPKLEVYRGLIFASLNPDAPSLESHLGKARAYLDVLLDEYGGEVTLAQGTTMYGYPGNWKLQVENALDYYHLPTVHESFFEIRKARGESTHLNYSGMAKDIAVYLGNGHGTVITRGDDAKSYDQHLFLFPNLVILEKPAPQFRVIHPLAADQTQVTGFAYFPKDAGGAVRDKYLRMYEIFYGPVGFGTPDDLEVFDACMEGFACEAAPWNDLSRGIQRERHEIDVENAPPFEIAGNITDDTVFRGLYRFWAARMGGLESP